jgi:hypothetical protein
MLTPEDKENYPIENRKRTRCERVTVDALRFISEAEKYNKNKGLGASLLQYW